MAPYPPISAAARCSARRISIISASVQSAYVPDRALPAPSVQVTPVNQRSGSSWQAPMAARAMNSRSSWWATMPRSVVRASASASGDPSGTITSAAARG